MEPTTAAASTVAALQEAATSLGGMESASLRAGGSRGMVAGASRGNLGMDAYCRCLASWRIDRRRMADWIAGVEHQPAPIARFGREALALVKRRAEPVLAKVVRLDYLRGTLAKAGTATPELVARLAALDEQRYTEPVVAGAAATQALEDATCADAAARTLGVWASSLRLQKQNAKRVRANLNRAHALLWLGMRLAGAAQRPWVLGDMLQRAVYLVVDRTADFDHARALGKAAEGIYRQLGDGDRTGRALVEQGFSLFLQECFEEARPLYERALLLLEQDSRMYHLAAHHALADIHARSGALARAEEHADHAARYRGKAQAERVDWLRARLATARGRLGEAARLYQKTMVAQGRLDPAKCGLASSEYAQVLLRQGDVESALRVCRGMRWLVFPLQDDLPEAADAVRQLNRAADEAETFARVAAMIACRLEQAIIQRSGDPVARPTLQPPGSIAKPPPSSGGSS